MQRRPTSAYPETSKVATAFTSVFRGAHTITISSDRQDVCKDPSTGKTDWNCTRGDLDTGAEMHLRAQDLGQAGLIFHEFGHLFTNSATRDSGGTLTNTPSEFNGDPNTYDFLKALDPTQAVLQQKAPNWSVKRIAQEIANNNFVSYSGDPDYYLRNAEATADAFAAWIMRDFMQQKEAVFTATEAEAVVNDFFVNILNAQR